MNQERQVRIDVDSTMSADSSSPFASRPRRRPFLTSMRATGVLVDLDARLGRRRGDRVRDRAAAAREPHDRSPSISPM
jgi:hypothetical protein